MTIIKTLFRFRHQSLKQTATIFNSIRLRPISSISEHNFDDEAGSETIVKPRNFSGSFSDKNVERGVETEEGGGMVKMMSKEMLIFVEEMYKGGYFSDANFLPGNAFDARCFYDTYSREYIKFAADKFANDHQEIAKWLSGSQVKKVALFGCPTLLKKDIFAAKRLRSFFRIQEDNVCSKCVLNDSCPFVNQSVWNCDTKKLKLDDTLRVIVLYALEATHPKLLLPDHFMATVNLLLRDIINLSKTTTQVWKFQL